MDDLDHRDPARNITLGHWRWMMWSITLRHWKLVISWAVSLIAAGALTAAAQRPPDAPMGGVGALITEAPTIISGPDIGFRLERTQNGIAMGKIVVRIDGKWIDTGSSPTVVPARR
jgi:hypothetical protein